MPITALNISMNPGIVRNAAAGATRRSFNGFGSDCDRQPDHLRAELNFMELKQYFIGLRDAIKPVVTLESLDDRKTLPFILQHGCVGRCVKVSRCVKFKYSLMNTSQNR